MLTVDQTLSGASSKIAVILDHVLSGHELDIDGAEQLFLATGNDLRALTATADKLRCQQVGEAVTYVINRNINFTNVCVKSCRFCAFSRDIRSESGYFLDTDAIVEKVAQAVEMGATEVCLQAGLAPTVDGRIYIDLCQTLHNAFPDVHLHAFSPEEIKYGSVRARMTFREYLSELKDAGLGSLPGTSAEILDDDLRTRISPGRITVDEWTTVIRTAHELGIPTTSTMMFGHIETAGHRARHMALLRDIQRDTGGFTEFVPLSFVHSEAPLFVTGDIPGVQPGPTGNDVLRLYAIARLMLGATFTNIQASWVKEGLRGAQLLLDAGVNDLGGTLMNESISTKAGASNGQMVTPAQLRQLVRDAGRVPVERTTLYGERHRFPEQYTPGEEDLDPLNRVTDTEQTFGSYDELVNNPKYHYDFEEYRVKN